ncbi:hypothetical protein [Plantactinospora sonchi]|uniref:SAV-6107-like HEPN domain-containing protein n=1 Tax=Plantactinospora sonchi TaxID=1544735 RepID=A0ABU7RY51_9ACTN
MSMPETIDVQSTVQRYRELFALVRKRPLMYLVRADYSSAVAFVLGCHVAEEAVLTGFREWLVTRVGCGSNLTWWSLILRLTDPVGPKNARELDPESDGKAFEALFSLLDEFLALRAEPDGLQRIYRAYDDWIQLRHTHGCDATGAPSCSVVDAPRPTPGG